MTQLLELSPETEARLKAAAAARGVSVGALASEVVTAWTQSEPQADGDTTGNGSAGANGRSEAEREAEKRRAAVYAGLGCAAGQGMSVDEFLAERHAVAVAEAEKDAQRLAA